MTTRCACSVLVLAWMCVICSSMSLRSLSLKALVHSKLNRALYSAIVASSFHFFPCAAVYSVDSPPTPIYSVSDPRRLKQGLQQLDFLLANWEEKTIYCNFGELQRELLFTENKAKLVKIAGETGLLDYDKSKTMNVMCRKDPEMVRAYFGLKPENPTLANAEKLMRRADVLERVEDLDKYDEAVEKYAKAVAAVDALSYGAHTDFSVTETSSRAALLQRGDSQSDYLSQAKAAVVTAREALAVVVEELDL